MKKIKLIHKLSLNKIKIVELNNSTQNQVVGGIKVVVISRKKCPTIVQTCAMICRTVHDDCQSINVGVSCAILTDA